MKRSRFHWAARVATTLAIVLASLVYGSSAAVAASASRTGPAGGLPGFAPGLEAQATMALAADSVISPAAAARRLAAQDRLSELGEKLSGQLGQSASGFWIDRSDGSLVVNVADPRAARIVWAAGARAHLVRHSMVQLNRIHDSLSRIRIAHTAIGIDVAANQVVVTIGGATGATAGLTAAAARYGSAVRIERVSGSFDPLISGGHPIDQDGSPGYGCSLGFNVTGGMAITAGHCTQIIARWRNGNNQRYFGPSIGVNFPGDDFGLIRNDGNLHQTGDVYVYYSGTRQDITGAAHNYVGQFVCKSGRTSGTTCAYIDRLNVTVHYPQGTVYQLVQGNFCSRPGDSGGAVFHGGTAKGLISGGVRGGCTTYYQPVVEALQAYGVWVY